MPAKSTECNISVICRVRPVNNREMAEAAENGWSQKELIPITFNDTTIDVDMDYKDSEQKPTFTLDRIFGMESEQEEVFNAVAKPVVKDAIKGLNSTIFAYGQTGSGKTFSIFGPEPFTLDNKMHMGILPRSAAYIFSWLKTHSDLVDLDETTFEISVCELYVGKQIRDLLHPLSNSGKELKIRESKTETYIQGLQHEIVENSRDVVEFINVAYTNRTVSFTKMNASSSRSHCVFTFYLDLKLIGGERRKSKLNFIDLAGSERVGKTDATGQRLVEATAINSSLSVLGGVISCLADPSKGSPPFREATLTQLLRDSLSGNTKTTLLVCVSPHKFNREETVTSLRFASRTKLIKTRVVVNKSRSPQQMRKIIAVKDKQVKNARKLLSSSKEAIFSCIDAETPCVRLAKGGKPPPMNRVVMVQKQLQHEVNGWLTNAGIESRCWIEWTTTGSSKFSWWILFDDRVGNFVEAHEFVNHRLNEEAQDASSYWSNISDVTHELMQTYLDEVGEGESPAPMETIEEQQGESDEKIGPPSISLMIPSKSSKNSKKHGRSKKKYDKIKKLYATQAEANILMADQLQATQDELQQTIRELENLKQSFDDLQQKYQYRARHNHRSTQLSQILDPRTQRFGFMEDIDSSNSDSDESYGNRPPSPLSAGHTHRLSSLKDISANQVRGRQSTTSSNTYGLQKQISLLEMSEPKSPEARAQILLSLFRAFKNLVDLVSLFNDSLFENSDDSGESMSGISVSQSSYGSNTSDFTYNYSDSSAPPTPSLSGSGDFEFEFTPSSPIPYESMQMMSVEDFLLCILWIL